MTDPQSKEEKVSSRKGKKYRGAYAHLWSDEDYLARIYSRCIVSESGCVLWQGWKNHKGYGEVSYRNKTVFVHRLIHLLKVGPIPPGKMVCHKCDVRACCNPEHLWLGDALTNQQDKNAKGRNYFTNKTHCKRGHEFTPDNTRWRITPKKRMRTCVACEAIRARSPEYKAKALERQRRSRAQRRSQVSI